MALAGGCQWTQSSFQCQLLIVSKVDVVPDPMLWIRIVRGLAAYEKLDVQLETLRSPILTEPPVLHAEEWDVLDILNNDRRAASLLKWKSRAKTRVSLELGQHGRNLQVENKGVTKSS